MLSDLHFNPRTRTAEEERYLEDRAAFVRRDLPLEFNLEIDPKDDKWIRANPLLDTQPSLKRAAIQSRTFQNLDDDVRRFAAKIPTDPLVTEARASLLEAMVRDPKVLDHIGKGVDHFYDRFHSAEACFVGCLFEDEKHLAMKSFAEWLVATPQVSNVPVLKALKSAGDMLSKDEGFQKACRIFDLVKRYQFDDLSQYLNYTLEEYWATVKHAKKEISFSRDGDLRKVLDCGKVLPLLLEMLWSENILSKETVPHDLIAQIRSLNTRLGQKNGLGHLGDEEYLRDVAGLIAALQIGRRLIQEAYKAYMPLVGIQGLSTMRLLFALGKYFRDQAAQGRSIVRPKVHEEQKWILRDASNMSLRTQDKSPLPFSLEMSSGKPLLILTGECSSGKSETARNILRIQELVQLGMLIEATAVAVPMVDQIHYCPLKPDDPEAEGGWYQQNLTPGTEVLFQHATPKSLIVLDEFGTAGTDTSDMPKVLKPAYFLITKAGIMTIHCTHFRQLARDYGDDPKVAIGAMAIRNGRPTRQIEMGRVADSNSLEVAEEVGLTMEKAFIRLRQLGIEFEC